MKEEFDVTWRDEVNGALCYPWNIPNAYLAQCLIHGRDPIKSW